MFSICLTHLLARPCGLSLSNYDVLIQHNRSNIPEDSNISGVEDYSLKSANNAVIPSPLWPELRGTCRATSADPPPQLPVGAVISLYFNQHTNYWRGDIRGHDFTRKLTDKKIGKSMFYHPCDGAAICIADHIIFTITIIFMLPSDQSSKKKPPILVLSKERLLYPMITLHTCTP